MYLVCEGLLHVFIQLDILSELSFQLQCLMTCQIFKLSEVGMQPRGTPPNDERIYTVLVDQVYKVGQNFSEMKYE